MPKHIAQIYAERYNAEVLPHEKHNAAWNLAPIVEGLASGQAQNFKPNPEPQLDPCVVVGSGPSLDDTIPLLQQFRGKIFCSSSQALTLVSYGIIPDYLVICDPFAAFSEINAIDWAALKTTLIMQPGCYPDWLATGENRWWGNILIFRPFVPDNNFYANDLKVIYAQRKEELSDEPSRPGLKTRHPTYTNLITTEFFGAGSVLPIQLLAANALGFSRVYTAGADFGSYAGKRRFTNRTLDAVDTWVDHTHPGEFTPEEQQQQNEYYVGWLMTLRLTLQNVAALTTDPFDAWPPELLITTYDTLLKNRGVTVLQTPESLTFQRDPGYDN